MGAKGRVYVFLRLETGRKFGTALSPSLGLLLNEVITFRDLIVDKLDFDCQMRVVWIARQPLEQRLSLSFQLFESFF